MTVKNFDEEGADLFRIDETVEFHMILKKVEKSHLTTQFNAFLSS